MQIKRSGQLNKTDFANRGNRHGGFTMVELIVIICILMILAGGIVTGIVKWIAWSDFKEQNDYAKTLYLAAQDQLTEYSANGLLDAKLLMEEPEGDGVYAQQVDVTRLVGSDNNPITLDSLWPARSGKTSAEQKRYTGTICYIMGTAEDYELYRDRPNELDPLKRVMYDMLAPYLYDVTILDATICVEFTPEDGQIYAVLYSNDNENKDFEFTYEATENLRGKDVSISSREVNYREDRMVGYWGVNTLSRATGATADKPVFVDVKLNNENTLNLSFRFSKVEEAINHLTYEIEVRDNTSKKKRMAILVDGTNLKAPYTEAKVSADCEVIRYDAEENKLDSRTYPVLIMQEADNTIRLVLDAADLSATSAYYRASGDELAPAAADPEGLAEAPAGSDVYKEFAKAYSFSRFGLDIENIYCTVEGYGDIYKTTAKKQSNASHVYFASGTSAENSGTVTDTYLLSNARHLYNIRFYEDSADAPLTKGKTDHKITYQLTRNIDWRQFIGDGGLYDTRDLLESGTDGVMAVTNEKTAFPAIQRLQKNAVLTSRGSRLYTISGLTLSEDVNKTLMVYDYYDGDTLVPMPGGEVGIFKTNYGTIQGVMLDQVQASGTDYVGTFCGFNAGILSNLRINNSNREDPELCSRITGEKYVGAFAGDTDFTTGGETIAYNNLGNYARVYGTEKVGGIVGSIEMPDTALNPVDVNTCMNYAAIEANVEKIKDETGEPDPVRARKIGGIVGSITNGTANENYLLIQNCTSVPEYTNAELSDIFADDESLEKKLNGVYVGGIAGYSENSTITNCRTENIGGSSAYIFGYQYVGGIVGFADFHTGDKAELDGDGGLNGANVIGNSYVGGITGANGKPGSAGENGVVLPDETRSENLNVSNWTNRGVVAAAESYAGGITGYNAGTVEECCSEVQSDADARIITGIALLQQADYVGGIVGNNKGWIVSDNTDSQSLDVISYLTGRNYVGGIAGQNETDAVISGYRLNGGYVKGTGAFVGGFIGMNVSAEIFSDKSVTDSELFEANPNEISGRYAVGGIIGGNLVPVADDTLNLYAKFNTNNFLGEITAKAFAGGFIGYNGLYKADSDDAADAVSNMEKVAGVAKQICDFSDTAKSWDNGTSLNVLSSKYADVIENQFGMLAFNPTTAKLIIQGTGAQSDGGMLIGSLKVNVYGGGVVGYNQEDTYLLIKDITNKTPVTANYFVEAKYYKNFKENADENLSYSYAGGIIGKVTKNAVIDHCGNAGEGDVTAGGNYLGGICEINEGTVQNCIVPSVNGESGRRIGGIVGLNKAGGIVSDCTFAEGSVISGDGNLGGIVADNYGTVQNIHLTGGSIHATGSLVGGIARRNLGNIYLNTSEAAVLYIDAEGNNVGGIVGENGKKLEVVSGSESARFEFVGSVSGNQYVGGIVGKNAVTIRSTVSGNSLKYMKNAGIVTAVNGWAGGIAGTMASSIELCENTGTVSAAKSGDAGGIIAENNGSIVQCVNTGVISSANGDCGGIASINRGRIVQCTVKGEGEQLLLTALNNAGGIAGLNQGQIQDGLVQNLVVSNTEQSGISSVGGIVGNNLGVIAKPQVIDCVIQVYTSGGNVGGIAGNNGAGISEGFVKGSTAIGFAGSNATYANMGGAAGFNTGGIAVCSVQADITGDMGTTDTGYGGIAGVNQGSVQECDFSGSIRANGSGDNIVSIGGIVGINRTQIIQSSVGTEKETTITSGYENTTAAMGYVGGICGQNQKNAVVVRCLNDSTSLNTVTVINYSGNTGGLIGYQIAGAKITDSSTGNKWEVESRHYVSGAGTGGIIGYCASGEDIIDVTNYAKVTSLYESSDNVATGGLIGRLENNNRNNMRIVNFVNYGDIQGTIAGGAIGRWKYKGAALENCINYGFITSTGTESKAAGGMVGNFMNMKEEGDRISFIACQNHGNISCKKDNGYGGISGSTSGYDSGKPSPITVIYTNCVNTGVVSGAKGGGIAGATDGQNTYFYQCRNYGYAASGTFCGIVGKQAGSNTKQTLQNCFSIGESYGVAYTSSYTSISNCYYWNEKGTTKNGGTLLKFPDIYTLKVGNYTWKCEKDIRTNVSRDEADKRYNLDAKSINEMGRRQRTFAQVDPGIAAYYEKQQSSTPVVVKNLSITNTGGWITVTWGHSDTKYDRDHLVYRIVDTDGAGTYETPVVVRFGVERYSIPMSDQWIGKTVEVSVRAVNSNYDDETLEQSGWVTSYGPETSRQEAYASKWVTAKKTNLISAVPTPEVHLELAPTDDNPYAFIAILDNQSAYEKDGKETTISVSGIPTENGSATRTISFTTEEGRSKPFSFTNAANQTVSVMAEANEKYAASTIVANEVALYGGANMQTTDYQTTSFDDFYGDRSGNLYNQIRLEKIQVEKKNTELYMNTELVVGDYAIMDDDGRVIANLPVTVARGNVHVTQYGGEMTGILNQLPEDFLNYGNVTVRTYPWKSQGCVCWYGHPIVENIKRDQLITYIQKQSLNDSQRNVPVFVSVNGTVQLNSGYILSMNADGTYSIIYSSILEYSNIYADKQIDQKVYTVNNGRVTGTDFSATVHPKPVIDPVVTLSEDGSQYTFNWDAGTSDANAVYDVQLTGRSVIKGLNGQTTVTEVLLETVTIDKNTLNADGKKNCYQNNGWTYTFVDRNDNWNYTTYTLSVTRVGTTGTSGKTVIFPAKSEQEFAVKLRFSQIARPTVSLHKDENGEVNKDTLIYDISWYLLTKAERDSGDIEAFEIKIAYTDGNGQEHVDKQIFKVSDPIPPGDNPQQEELLDLNAYAPGQTLRISVRALAKEDAVTYRDGVEGVVREITLPSRQSVPNINMLTAEPVYDAEQFVTQDAWEDGIKLTVSDAEIQQTGKYEIAVSVYDEKTEPGRETVSEGDAPNPDAAGYWNSGALATLVSKASRTTMEGNLASATYQLVTGLKTDYAGKWLKIALRNISESNISSNWTDEDADGISENYAWIQLPRLQIESVEISNSDTNIYYDPDTGTWSFKDSGVSGLVLVNQTALDLGLVDRAAAYKIEIVPEDRTNDNAETQNPGGIEDIKADSLYLEAVEGEPDIYNVFYSSAEEETDSDSSAETGEPETGETENGENETGETENGETEELPVCSQNEKAVFIGKMDLHEAGNLQLPLTRELVTNAEPIGVDAVMLLNWKKAEEGKNREIQLILPEAESITLADGTEYQNNANRFSGEIAVQALVSEKDRKRYEDSLPSGWMMSYIAVGPYYS